MSQQVRERWVQRCSISSFHWASWGDEHVIYDDASGQTHVLDPVKAYILETLADGPASVTALALPFVNMLPAPTAESPEQLVEGALEQLVRSQLVETVSR